jgi:hypothetical protein
VPIYYFPTRHLRFRVLECGAYLTRTDCQLGFCFSVFRRLTGEGQTNYQERILKQEFFEKNLGRFLSIKSGLLRSLTFLVEKNLGFSPNFSCLATRFCRFTCKIESTGNPAHLFTFLHPQTTPNATPPALNSSPPLKSQAFSQQSTSRSLLWLPPANA